MKNDFMELVNRNYKKAEWEKAMQEAIDMANRPGIERRRRQLLEAERIQDIHDKQIVFCWAIGLLSGFMIAYIAVTAMLLIRF